MKNILAIIGVLVALSLSATTIKLGTGFKHKVETKESSVSQSPVFDMEISDDSTSVTFSCHIPTVDVKEDTDLYPGTYWWSVDGFAPSDIAGEASLPRRSIVFELPFNAENVTLTENHAEWQTISSYTPTPARPQLFMVPDAKHTLDNVLPISALAQKRRPVAKISYISNMRDGKLAVVSIEPFQYAVSGVNVCHDFSYTLSFNINDKMCRPKNRIIPIDTIGGITIPLDSMIKPDTHPLFECREYERPSKYLILTTPRFYDIVNDYAKWKKSYGHATQVISTESWTPNLIKNTISTIYQDSVCLDYVLFAGSINEVPSISFRKNVPDRGDSDFPYAVMDSAYTFETIETELPFERNVFTGRMLADTPEQMENIVYKLRHFYVNGSNDINFYRRATHISYCDDTGDTDYLGLSWISEQIRSQAMDNGKSVTRAYYKAGYHGEPKYWYTDTGKMLMPLSLQYPNHKWNADSNAVMKAFNGHNHYILYNGHGGENAWGDHYRHVFKTRQIANQSNEGYLPYLFMISCRTGNFQEQDGIARCLLNSKTGASGAIASTNSMRTTDAKRLAACLFQMIWPYPRPGHIIMPMPVEPINLNENSFGYDAIHKRIIPEERYALGNLLDAAIRNTLVYKPGTEDKDPSTYMKKQVHIYGDPGLFFNNSSVSWIRQPEFTYQSIDSMGIASLVLRSYAKGIVNPYYVRIKTDATSVIGFYNESTNEVHRYIHDTAEFIVSHNDHFHITISRHNKIPYEFHVENGIISAVGPFTMANEHGNNGGIAISARQVNSNTINVSYEFEQSDAEPYDGIITLKDLSGNVMATCRVSDQSGCVSLDSHALRQGIYVVTLEPSDSQPVYTKILIN